MSFTFKRSMELVESQAKRSLLGQNQLGNLRRLLLPAEVALCAGGAGVEEVGEGGEPLPRSDSHLCLNRLVESAGWHEFF